MLSGDGEACDGRWTSSSMRLSPASAAGGGNAVSSHVYQQTAAAAAYMPSYTADCAGFSGYQRYVPGAPAAAAAAAGYNSDTGLHAASQRFPLPHQLYRITGTGTTLVLTQLYFTASGSEKQCIFICLRRKRQLK